MSISSRDRRSQVQLPNAAAAPAKKVGGGTPPTQQLQGFSAQGGVNLRHNAATAGGGLTLPRPSIPYIRGPRGLVAAVSCGQLAVS